MVITRRFTGNKEGQLLLTTGVVMAVLLLVLATINANSANTLRIPSRSSAFPVDELSDLSRNFERGVMERSGELTGIYPKKEAVQIAFEEVRDEYTYLLSGRGIIFEAHRGNIEGTPVRYDMDVTITLIYNEGVESFIVSETEHWEIILD